METLNKLVDRKIAPAFKAIEKIEMIKADERRLRNNIPVYAINAGTQELIKIEFLFEAGMYHQQMPLLASTTNAMMEEGTSKMNADQIADAVDYYGAFLETGVSQDHASIALYTLNKHLPSVLPFIEQIIKDSIFPKEQMDIYLTNKKQEFILGNQRVATLARKRFSELLFGENHPYGRDPKERHFEELTREHLVDFYKSNYRADRCKIILAGKVEDEHYKLLDNLFGGNDWVSGKESTVKTFPINALAKKEEVIVKADALQSAIRIGRILFNKTNPDYHPMQLLNTVFGGYFGSRLMSNIREDKGYTYGIGSGLVSLQHGGYFFISTEVGVDVTSKAINEIYYEMNKLREELISEDELQLVKNYMLGSFLRSVDGPFAMAERFKGVMLYNLGYDTFDKYLATIRTTSSSSLQELANKYLDKNTMIELVAGKKD
jgi:predicted Zn-dependent peptidase